MHNHPIKTLIVDDHEVLRKSFSSLLNMYDELNIVGSCEDGIYVDAFLANNDVDLILMDYNMKIQGGLETTKEIKKKYPNVVIIGLSSHTEEYIKKAMIEAGACDYIVKSSDVEDMLYTIKKCASK